MTPLLHACPNASGPSAVGESNGGLDDVERGAPEARVAEVRVLVQDERRDLMSRFVTLVAVAKDHLEPGSMERDDSAPKPSVIKGHVHGRVPKADAVHLVSCFVTLVAVAKDHVEPGSMERDDSAPKPSVIEGHVHGRVPKADAVRDAACDDGPLCGGAPRRSRQLWLAA